MWIGTYSSPQGHIVDHGNYRGSLQIAISNTDDVYIPYYIC